MYGKKDLLDAPWKDVLNDKITIKEYWFSREASIDNCFGRRISGQEYIYLLHKQYEIDKKRMKLEGIAAEDIGEPQDNPIFINPTYMFTRNDFPNPNYQPVLIPSWVDVLNGLATIDDFVDNILKCPFECWRNSFSSSGTINLLKAQYLIDKKQMEIDGISAEELCAHP